MVIVYSYVFRISFYIKCTVTFCLIFVSSRFSIESINMMNPNMAIICI